MATTSLTPTKKKNEDQYKTIKLFIYLWQGHFCNIHINQNLIY